MKPSRVDLSGFADTPDLTTAPGPLLGRDGPVDLAAVAMPDDPEPDPLVAVDPGLPLEEAAAAEQDALMSAFRQRARREQERYRLATDSEFWVALCFQSREQLEVFLAGMGWDDLARDTRYLDGTVLARRQGIRLPKVDLRGIKRRVDLSWQAFVSRRGAR